MYQDKTLTCRDCGNDYTFTAGEQEFYASKGFENEPVRCPECRTARKRQPRNGNQNAGGRRPQRQMFEATCDECGEVARVPFRPTEGKPVYCKDCFQARV